MEKRQKKIKFYRIAVCKNVTKKCTVIIYLIFNDHFVRLGGFEFVYLRMFLLFFVAV